MSVPTIPQHHGQDMTIVNTKLKCQVCGFEMPNPGEAGIGEAPPKHCGKYTLLLRDLKCGVCGYEMPDTVRFDEATAQPVTPVPAPPPRRKRVALQPVTVTDLVGKTWARYRIVCQLGRGGMAVVYKAYQPGLDRHVAIKFLLPQVIPDPTLIKRFKQEAKVIAKLRYPNIVTVLDFGERQGVAYLVMEYVEGETLKAKLGKPMPLESALEIASQMGRALDYAHSQGIIHRDVKPSNILLAREDWALLSDFGIAKVLEGPQQFTMTGASVGTPEYMAPEQGQGLKVDARADIYALGVVLYEMLTGRPPFSGDTPLSVMLKHVTDLLPPPRNLNANVPEAVEQVIVKAMAKDPAARYASAREMVAALESLRGTQIALAPAPSPEAPTLMEGKPAQVESESDKATGEKRRRRWPF